MYKEHKVVSLLHEDTVCTRKRLNMIVYEDSTGKEGTPMIVFSYILGEDSIKENEYYINYNSTKGLYLIKSDSNFRINNPNTIYKNQSPYHFWNKPIVATNDLLLISRGVFSIPDSFTKYLWKEYAKDSIINKVFVKYEGFSCKNGHYMKEEGICKYTHCHENCNIPQLKLNLNNTISLRFNT